MAFNPYRVQNATENRVDSGTRGPAVSEREDLADFISMITRDETPFISAIGKTKASAVYHEWQADYLQAPVDQAYPDGSDYTAVAPQFGGTSPAQDYDNASPVPATFTDQRTRFGNYTQIVGKTVAVSGTKRAVDQAGVADEYAYQLKKRGTELKRDIEWMMFQNQIAVGTGTRRFAALPTWLNHPTGATALGSPTGTAIFKNNTVSGGVVVAAPGADARGEGSTGITFGSGTRSTTLELSDIDDIMQAIHEAGGTATRLMVSPRNRRVFSAKAQTSGGGGGFFATAPDANTRRNIDEMGSLRQSVDIYMSDFGQIMVESNYIMGLFPAATLSSNTAYTAMPRDYMALVWDPMWFNYVNLRPLQEVDVAQRGDSTVGLMVEELSLEVRNPIGCGAIYGLNGS